MSPIADPADSIPNRRADLFRMLARGPLGGAGEGVESTRAADEVSFSAPDVARQIDHTRGELHRIVRDYLGGQCELYRLADEIAARGERAMTADVAAFERQPALLGDLEAIVRTDGSRPSFLVVNGQVDRKSSPLGLWADTLDGAAADLERAVACVGRLNTAATGDDFAGSGFLVHPNLVLTNRHVLQGLGTKDGSRWVVPAAANIDFGHEFRGQASVGRRAIRGAVYVGPAAIDPDVIDHAKLDLVVLELAPADDEPLYRLSVERSADWPTGGPAVFTIGYPAAPPVGGRYKLSLLEQLFQSTFSCKRLAPGLAGKPRRATAAAWTVGHDATTLGGNSGSVVVVAGRPRIAAGLHYGGGTREPAENWAHVLGLALDTVGEGGRTLGDVLSEYGVVFSDRTVTPAGGG